MESLPVPIGEEPDRQFESLCDGIGCEEERGLSRPRREVLEYRSYELPSGFPLVVLTGDEWRISSTPSPRLHFHNCLEVGICHSGSGTMVFNRHSVQFGPGCITCVARNIPHTTWSDPNNTSLWSYLFLDPELLLGQNIFSQLAVPAQGRDFLSNSYLVLSPESAPWSGTLMRAIMDEYAQQDAGYQASIRGYCLVLLIHLMRVYYSGDYADTARDESTHVISPALDYIHQHYSRKFDQKHLADLCHLSVSHFRRLFKEQIGVSPLAFIHQTRILNSCILLRSSEQLISEIASIVGYDSLSNFNRHFQEIMGQTPSQWRTTLYTGGRPSLLTFTGWRKPDNPEGQEP